MTGIYKHLTHSTRSHIYAYNAIGKTQKEIARLIERSQSTVSRELRRNASAMGYCDIDAQKQAEQRCSVARSNVRSMDPHLWSDVLTGLGEQQSPDQIAGALRRQGKPISYQTIYGYIKRDKTQGGTLYKYLRQRGKKRNKQAASTAGRGHIPHRVGIEHRPASVELKATVGDMEGDTVVGPRGKSKQVLITMVDRHSKFVFIWKAQNKTKKSVTKKIIDGLKGVTHAVSTLTFDNGKEFAGHEEITAALQAACYFARPYHSWERGLNEHTNGLIRGYFPKGTDFSKVTDEEVAIVQKKLNNRPRKVLGYRTPQEVFGEALGHSEVKRLDSS